MTKKWRFALIESYGERKGRKLFEKVFDPSETLVLKNVPHNFGLIETLGSIDRNRQRLTQKFWINFDWSKTSSIDRNSRKNTVLRKTAQILHKILKALKNMSKMHEYEMQRFSKTQVLNPIIPNLRFSNILHKFSKHQIYFAQKIQSIRKLGWSNQRYTQLYVQCLAKSNWYSVWN